MFVCVCVCLKGHEMQSNKIGEIVHGGDESFPLPGGLWVCSLGALLKRLVLLSVSLGQRDAGGRTGLNVFLGLSESMQMVKWMEREEEILKISPSTDGEDEETVRLD